MNQIEFQNIEEDLEAMAIFIAKLREKGVGFSSYRKGSHWVIIVE